MRFAVAAAAGDGGAAAGAGVVSGASAGAVTGVAAGAGAALSASVDAAVGSRAAISAALWSIVGGRACVMAGRLFAADRPKAQVKSSGEPIREFSARVSAPSALPPPPGFQTRYRRRRDHVRHERNERFWLTAERRRRAA